MYKNILIPMALDHKFDVGAALAIAHKLLDNNGQVTALHVMEAIPDFASVHLPNNYQEKRQTEAKAELRTQLGDIKDVKSALVTGHAGRTIQSYAEQHDCDCIIMASHQPGLQDIILGSTAAWVVRHAKCAVHVIR